MPLPPPLLPLLLPLQHLHHKAALGVLSTDNAMLCATPDICIDKAQPVTRCCSAVLMSDQNVCSLACSRSCVAVSWGHEIDILTLYSVQWRAAICTAKKVSNAETADKSVGSHIRVLVTQLHTCSASLVACSGVMSSGICPFFLFCSASSIGLIPSDLGLETEHTNLSSLPSCWARSCKWRIGCFGTVVGLSNGDIRGWKICNPAQSLNSAQELFHVQVQNNILGFLGARGC